MSEDASLLAGKFCRQDAIRLAQTTSSRLSYLERCGFVTPERIGGGFNRKPIVLYTAADIDQIVQVNTLGQYFTAETIRSVLAGEEPISSAVNAFLQQLKTENQNARSSNSNNTPAS